MAATMATTMAVLNANCLITSNSPKAFNSAKPAKPISLLSVQSVPKGLTASKASQDSILSNPLTGTALASAIFSTLSSCDAAFAAQQIAVIAEGDNRGLALLLPIIPAVLWVLFNILQPALNQLNQMRSARGIIIGLGLGGVAVSGFNLIHPLEASAAASEVAAIAAEATNDNRGQLLLFVILPAILWVLYNILQPALNQFNRMRT